MSEGVCPYCGAAFHQRRRNQVTCCAPACRDEHHRYAARRAAAVAGKLKAEGDLTTAEIDRRLAERPTRLRLSDEDCWASRAWAFSGWGD